MEQKINLTQWEEEEIIKLAQTKYRVHTCEFDNRPDISKRAQKKTQILRDQFIKRRDEIIVNFVSRHEGCTEFSFLEAWKFFQSNVGIKGAISSLEALRWAITMAESDETPLVFVRGGVNWNEWECGRCFGTRGVWSNRPENILSYEKTPKL